MKRIICVVLCVVLVFASTSCASLSMKEPYTDGIVDFRDPFSAHLNLYEAQIKDSKKVMWAGVSVAAGSFAGATTTQSLIGFDKINSNWKWGTLSLSITSIIGLGVTIYGFAQWDKASKNYIETLHLQTQYSNLVR